MELENEVMVNDKAITISSKDFITVQDNHARAVAILFAEYLSGEGFQQYDDSNRWISPTQSLRVYTTHELYDHAFMQHINKK